MLKHAYQLGLQQALNDGNAEQLLKEAQALGIDLEKLALWGSLMGAGKSALGLGKAWGQGIGTAAKQGYGAVKGAWQGGAGLGQSLGQGARNVGRSVGQTWKGLTPGQQLGTVGTMTGVGGLGAGGLRRMFGGENPSTSNNQFGY
jgi:hypothetical protein